MTGVVDRSWMLARLTFGVFLLAAGFTAHAQTLYWRTTAGTWTTTAGPGNNNWSTAAGGSASLPWANGDAAVIDANHPTITIGDAALSVASLDATNGATLTGTFTTLREVVVAGAGNGNLIIDGSQLGTNGRLRLTLNGSGPSDAWNGTLSLSGARSPETSSVLVNSVNATSTATIFNLDNGGSVVLGPTTVNGTVTIGGLSGTGRLTPNSSGDFAAGTKTLRIEQSSDTTFTGVTELGAGGTNLGLAKAGSGTLVIGAGAIIQHPGATTVEAGRLLLNATNVSNQTVWIVKSGATLGGTGLIRFLGGANRILTVESGGLLAPGDAAQPGTLTISGSASGTTTGVGLAFDGSATIKLRLGTPGVEQDRISLANFQLGNGAGSAGGGVGSIQFSLTNFSNHATTGPYDLINFATAPGIPVSAFALASESVSAGWTGAFSYNGNTLRLQVTSVPEPSVIALALGAVAAVALRRRRAPTVPQASPR